MNQSQAHADSFLFALLDLQADGAFQDGVSLVGFPDEEPETFIAFLQDLACCSFFSKGTSSIDFVLKKEGQGKSQIEEMLNKFVPFLKSEGIDIAIRFDEEWAPASSKRPAIVYAADEDIARGRVTCVFMPGNLPLPEKAHVEKEYGFRLGHAEAWLDKSFDGKAINFPGEIYLAPRPFERKEKGWQKAYSALFAYYVEGYLKNEDLLTEANTWFSYFQGKAPEERYELIKATYRRKAGSPIEAALYDLAAEEHRRWELRTLVYADPEVIADKARKGMMVGFERLVDAYLSSPSSRDIIVYDYLDVLAAFDFLFGDRFQG